MTDTRRLSIGADGVVTDPLLGEVRLTPKEATVLVTIAGRNGGLVTRDGLMAAIYNGRDEAAPKIVDVFVCKLRTKLKALDAGDCVQTVWGHGHKWNRAYALDTPGDELLNVELSRETVDRLDELSLALGRPVDVIVAGLVVDNIDRLERETWA